MIKSLLGLLLSLTFFLSVGNVISNDQTAQESSLFSPHLYSLHISQDRVPENIPIASSKKSVHEKGSVILEIEEVEEKDKEVLPAVRDFSGFSAGLLPDARAPGNVFCNSKNRLLQSKHFEYLSSTTRYILFQVFRI